MMRHGILTMAAALGLFAASTSDARAQERVTIRVDTNAKRGPMTTMWSWFGHDEPNYTYMKDGRKLLAELQKLSPKPALAGQGAPPPGGCATAQNHHCAGPVFMRTHNLLTSGDGKAALKWGSTNAYTEDASGKPVYNWTIVDSIIDTYIRLGIKPFVEIGFMPEALTTHTGPYRHYWKPGDNYNDIYTGWAYPPKDYEKWSELVYEWVKHSVEKYGQSEVESWWWQLWNEPDIGYWRGTQEEFLKLYDYTVAGLKRALPTARIGGPEVTGPLGARTQGILRNFIEHTLRGTNHVTGRVGTPLDLIAFHAKGAPRTMPAGCGREGAPACTHVRMNVGQQLRAIHNGFSIVASFPEHRRTPIVIGESDPEGCAACPARVYPANTYRNGTMYSSYTAEQITRTYELADLHGVNLLGSVTWAFEFEEQPYFDGFRDLATNGINKPVLNVFRMLGMMGGDRVAVQSSHGLTTEAVRDSSVNGRPDIYALATRDARAAAVMVFNYHDDDLPAPAAQVELTIEGLPAGRVTLTHYRVDKEYGNSYEAWKKMGSPPQPTTQQYAALEQASQLHQLEPARPVAVNGGRVVVPLTLPRQGVSLIKLTW